MNSYKIKEAYKNLCIEDFTGGTNAPVGAMSSGPELTKLQTDPKFSIYNLFKPKKKKDFDSIEEAEKFMEENPNWSLELKESIENIEYNTDIIKDNSDLHNKWIKLKEQYEIIHYETKKWLELNSKK